MFGSSTDGASVPLSAKRHRRWVLSASTRTDEKCTPSGIGVAEYSLSTSEVVTRVRACDVMSMRQMSDGPLPSIIVYKIADPSGVNDGWLS